MRHSASKQAQPTSGDAKGAVAAMNLKSFLIGALLLMGHAGCAHAQAPGSYPVAATEATLGDARELARLETPGEVFFSDGFEGKASLGNYFEIRGLEERRARLVGEPPAYSGSGAIQFDAPAKDGQSSGAGASYWFGPEGHQVVYFRRYIKFAAGYDQGNMNHTGGGLTGVAGSNPWDGMGQAGIRPDGTDRFTCDFEPWRDWQRYPAPGYMFLYTYWVDMKVSSDGHYWGNFIEPAVDRHLVLERDQWYCLEQMIRVNDLGQANGELAAWIDGQLYLHYRGFRWRLAEGVKIKRADFGIYIHEARQDNTVWYDEVALSTGYIGPLAKPETEVKEQSWSSLKKQGD